MDEYTGGLPILAQEIGNAVWRWNAQCKEISVAKALEGIIIAAREIGRTTPAPGVTEELRSNKFRSILRKIGTNSSILSNNEFSRSYIRDLLSEEEMTGVDHFLRRMKKLGAILQAKSGERGVYRFPNRLHALYFYIEGNITENKRTRSSSARLRRKR